MRKNSKALLLLLVLALCISSLNGCKEEQQIVEQPETSVLLMGFESYEEVVGSKIAVGNMLGRMEINTDEAYITQGSGSLKVRPQGFYNQPEYHPYFKLDFLNTACTTCDFSKFKNVSVDVYNPQSKELKISINFFTGKSDGNFISTMEQTFTLKPNGWTTCAYDLSVMGGFTIYDFTSVRYMTVKFLDHKQSRDDAMNELYFDNLQGTLFAEGEGPIITEFDFRKGLDFETAGTELVFTGQGKADTDATITRVSYKDLDIAPLENGGEYALRIGHTTHYWPTFRINFGEELPAGTEISFMAYGLIHGESVYNQSIFEFSGGGEATVQFSCDQWQKLTITLPANATYLDLFWNYDRASITSGVVPGDVYIDNIVAADPIPPIEPEGSLWDGLDFEIPGNAGLFVGQKIEGSERKDATIEHIAYAQTDIPVLENGGEYALRLSHDSNYWPTFRINFGQWLSKGTTITFYAYARITEGTSVYNQSVFEFSSGGEATEQFKCDKWVKLEMKLPKGAEYIDLFWNYDRANITSQTASAEVYIDNMIAIPPVTPVGDFLEGIDFERSRNEAWFTSVGGEHAWRDATIQRVTYERAGIPAPENGGKYALKLTCESSQWPVFRIEFGKTLKAGTIITFDAYTNDTSGIRNTVTSFAYVGGDDAVPEYPHGSWNTRSFVLPADCSYIDLECNMDRWFEPGPANLAVYLDNFKAVEPIPAEGSFTEGVDFEIEGNVGLFSGLGNTGSDATIQRIAYADTNVTAPANGGSYALKLSHTDHCWPTFRIQFGEILKAGTTITFDFYGNYDYAAPAGTNKYVKLELTGESKQFAESEDPNQVVWTLVEIWQTAAITLTADSDYIDLMYNVADGQHGNVTSWILLDNFKAGDTTEPEPSEPEVSEPEVSEPEVSEPEVSEPEVSEPVGNIAEGLDFEDAGDALHFTGTGSDQDTAIERVSYSNAGVTAPVNGGSYALKLSHANHCWPSFRLNFGKTLKAGTTITFDVYGNYDSSVNGKYVKLELAAASKNVAKSDDPNQVVWTLVKTWKTATITLTADTDHVDFFYNVADGQHGNVASWLLLDNFKANVPGEPTEPTEPTEPENPTISFTQGIDFEDAGEEALFAGQGNPSSDVTFERVTYAAANVAAPANGGSYALKLSHANHCWPSFRVNFGKTLKAGTTITFNVYGDYDYAAAAGVNKYMKLELTANSKKFAKSSDPNQVVWTLVKTWKTATITLTADTDHVDFFYNVADGQHGNVASWLLLDNFKAEELAEAPGGITEGIGFENAENVLHFTGDAAAERVAYANVNVTAPANGGRYAMKVSHANGCWPAFRIDFGQTLKAGTTITFDFYGNYDYAAPAGVNKYMKLELSANSKKFAKSDDPNQVVWTLVGIWKTNATITLTADTDYVEFFYNVADGQHGNVASWILLDNFKAVEPDA